MIRPVLLSRSQGRERERDDGGNISKGRLKHKGQKGPSHPPTCHTYIHTHTHTIQGDLRRLQPHYQNNVFHLFHRPSSTLLGSFFPPFHPERMHFLTGPRCKVLIAGPATTSTPCILIQHRLRHRGPKTKAPAKEPAPRQEYKARTSFLLRFFFFFFFFTRSSPPQPL